MPTVICKNRGFAFIHIPKCGGTAIGHQLRRYDDVDGQFFDQGCHPHLGQIEYAHIPLPWMRDYFPESLALVESLACFAVARDPLARFRSSIAQRMRQHEGVEISTASAAQIEHVIRDVCQRLEDDSLPRAVELSHFMRQTDFVTLDGRCIVRNVFPIERLDLLAERLSTLVGSHIDGEERLNQTLAYRVEALRPVIWHANAMARRLVPNGVYRRLKPLAVGFFTTQRATVPDIFSAPWVTDFIKAFYADDFVLHREALCADVVLAASPTATGITE